MSKLIHPFDPRYNKDFRKALYQPDSPPELHTLDDIVNEFTKIADFIRNKKDDEPLMKSSGSGRPLFEATERALLGFLRPQIGTGATIIYQFREYHDKNAGHIFNQIISSLQQGKTVILDLGSADPAVMEYYSEQLSWEVFKSQMDKFTSNALGNKYVQLYFEEAHNLFPKDGDVTGIYARLAKEGAKYHIGMVYSTQSPSTINRDLLAQTENFFIAHMSSRNEVKTLADLNVAYEDLQEDILQAKSIGYIRMLTRSHRFVVPVQARKFSPISINPTES